MHYLIASLEKAGQQDMAKTLRGNVMAISQAICTSFEQEILQGIHNFTNGSGGGTTTTTGTGIRLSWLFIHQLRIAGAGTTAYATTNEVSGTGYSAGGGTLTNVTPSTSGTTALTDLQI